MHLFYLLGVLVTASHTYAFSSHGVHPSKRLTSLDNVCGPETGLSCDPSSPNGGPCCSSAGWCGTSDAHCNTGCQPAFGTCKHDLSLASSPTSAASDTTPTSSSGSVTSSDACYMIPGVGTYNNHALYDFTTLTDLPADLVPTNETSPEHQSHSAPFALQMDSNLVSVSNSTLNLLVPGGQSASPVLSAEVGTIYTDILYASVRTRALFSAVPGTCHGLFFYHSDEQESDIEYLTDPSSNANTAAAGSYGSSGLPIQYTNQAADGNTDDATTAAGPGPLDATSAFHEYRIDWTPGRTVFLLDGVVQKTFTTNVPDVPGGWLWNNWSNGDKEWSAGPPAQDNVLRIQSIEMYYNRTSDSGGCASMAASAPTSSNAVRARDCPVTMPWCMFMASLPLLL